MTIKGVDVASPYQDGWRPQSGEDFVFVKASQNNNYTNPCHDAQVKLGRDAGLVIGHYHWMGSASLASQLSRFVAAAKVQSGDIIAVDWEQAGVSCAAKDSFIRSLKAKYPNNKVILYCNTSHWLGVDTTGYYGDGLWIAKYGASSPGIQTPWLFWQYTQTGKSGSVTIDKNKSVFGSRAELKAWASSKASTVTIDTRAKVAFRGGWTCGCVATSLPLVEQDMIKRGLIKQNIDIWQLGYRGDVAASAGTHNKGGCTDVDQYSDAQIKVWWEWGWSMQHRTPAQGFMHHAHGWPVGCPHLSTGAQSQARSWANGRNGLISNLAVPNWPGVINWKDALKRKAATVADDAAKEEEVARDRISPARSKTQPLKKVGTYQTLWTTNSSDCTVAFGPANVDANVYLVVSGLKAGQRVYVRAYTVDYVKGKPVRNKGSETDPQKLTNDTDGWQWGPALPYSLVIGGPGKGATSRRLRFEWTCPDNKNVKIEKASVAGWSEKK